MLTKFPVIFLNDQNWFRTYFRCNIFCIALPWIVLNWLFTIAGSSLTASSLLLAHHFWLPTSDSSLLLTLYFIWLFKLKKVFSLEVFLCIKKSGTYLCKWWTVLQMNRHAVYNRTIHMVIAFMKDNKDEYSSWKFLPVYKYVIQLYLLVILKKYFLAMDQNILSINCI